MKKRGQSRLARLPEDVYVCLIERIRLGAFPHIAAQSLGICQGTFYLWLQYGEAGKSRVYSQFYEDVMQAAAEARISRELYVAEHQPLEWLKLGPGKTTKDSPGWTDRKEEEKTITQEIKIEESRTGIVQGALQELADLGLVALTQEGQVAFQGLPQPKDDVVDEEPYSKQEGTSDRTPKPPSSHKDSL